MLILQALRDLMWSYPTHSIQSFESDFSVMGWLEPIRNICPHAEGLRLDGESYRTIAQRCGTMATMWIQTEKWL